MTVSIKISAKEIEFLQSMIGKTFEKFKCDPFIFSPMVYGLVGIYVDGKIYKFSAFHENIQYFFVKDDVAKIKITEATDSEIVSMMDNGEFIETPVKAKITSITVVNDYQKVVHDKDERCVESTLGVIFHFEDNHEISFEVPTWFSEMITIRKGYDLINKFVSENNFLEEWRDSEGYIASTKREIIVLR